MKKDEFSNIENIFVENNYQKRNKYCYHKRYSSGVVSCYIIYDYPDYYKLVHLIDDKLVFSKDFVSLIGLYKELINIFGTNKGRI